ncbi:interferon gamma 1-like isoform X2 [Scleropages formosus]|uniref:interferon gamma 1-like isoform X2 n=1 Tax=Scleropages formosus TaxID=113540 RepID=UPI00087864F5|nr:interferon gamma 1-like isoform X2 [Scleropages formosus]
MARGNNTSDKALFRDPVFLRNLQDLESRFEEGEQKVLMGELLDVYLSILEDMMNRTEDDNLKRSITLTRNRVSDLRKHHFQSKGHLKTQLQDLWAIETDDPLVQRKAVRELTTVFHKASVLGSKKKVPARRRRRQAGRRRI